MVSRLSALRLRLEPATRETQYRLAVLPRNARALRAILLVAAVFHLGNIPGDLSVTAASGRFRLVLGTRIAGAVVALAALLLLRDVRSPDRLDRIGTAWGIATAGIVVTSFAALPPDYLAYVAWSSLLVLAMYVALPIPIRSQAAIAAIYTAGEAVVLSTFRQVELAVGLDILTAHACAHAVGVVASWQMQRARRDQFLALREAEHAHTQEQRAWSELKVLQGIIPICSHCRKVRTEAGGWSQLETYVQGHSEALFSHGICPDCELRLYPPG